MIFFGIAKLLLYSLCYSHQFPCYNSKIIWCCSFNFNTFCYLFTLKNLPNSNNFEAFLKCPLKEVGLGGTATPKIKIQKQECECCSLSTWSCPSKSEYFPMSLSRSQESMKWHCCLYFLSFQVRILMSLLPKRVLQEGEKRSQDYINSIKGQHST